MTIEQQTGPHKPSSPILVVLAWVVVAIPALWGISMSARTASQLFRHDAARPASAPANSTLPARNP